MRFGVRWQHGEEDTAPTEFADPRIRLLDTHWRQSRGACWARAEIMKLWNHEDFFLQIDSHHRFVQDWDAKLLAHAERSGAARPLLTAYVAGYQPDGAAPAQGTPAQMDFDRFTEAGIPLFRPRTIDNWEALDRAPRARFVSAHFLFTLGSFVDDVPYDPELYFIGEEIVLAIRAFTHGYALLHPPEHILWHEYTRAHRRKHWDDHVRGFGVDMEWHARDAVSVAKVRRFLTQPHVGPFGCGAARTFSDYEAYAGLNFVHRAAQDATLQGLEPPNPPLPPTWATETRTWRARINLERAKLPEAALNAPRLWYVGFHDCRDVEIYREDASGEEVRRLAETGAEQIVIEREFCSARRPISWTVWRVAADGEWLEKIMGAPEFGA